MPRTTRPHDRHNGVGARSARAAGPPPTRDRRGGGRRGRGPGGWGARRCARYRWSVLVIVVDTATPAVTAALAELRRATGEILAPRVSVDARAHGELLAPGLRGVLREADVKPAELAAVVAGVGPGPFTGLRVGLVSAAALGHSLAVATYGVCSLDAIGWRQPGTVLAVTDARRKELYW